MSTSRTLSGGVGGSGVQPSLAEGRLSAHATDPVGEATSSASIYYHRFVGDSIAIYNGTVWERVAVPATTSLALSGGTASLPHDVFGFNDSGSIGLEILAWTNDTTRATTIVRQDGAWCKTGALTRRYLGTIYLDASKQVTFDSDERGVWNVSNRRQWESVVHDTTSSWTYTTASFRETRASTANRLYLVVGIGGEDLVIAKAYAVFNSSAGGDQAIGPGIGVNSTTTNSAELINGFSRAAGLASKGFADYSDRLADGRSYLSWLEIAGTSGTTTFFGAAGPSYHSGLVATSWH